MARASFALGCFWGPDASFSKFSGVLSTRVGYAGGTKLNPTYEDPGDHSETVEMEYDPKIISYEELLRHFWSQHDPTERQRSQYYASIIFYHTDEQRRLAEASKETQQKKYQRPILTRVIPASMFTLAEEYHQKYYQKLGKGRQVC